MAGPYWMVMIRSRPSLPRYMVFLIFYCVVTRYICNLYLAFLIYSFSLNCPLTHPPVTHIYSVSRTRNRPSTTSLCRVFPVVYTLVFLSIFTGPPVRRGLGVFSLANPLARLAE
ncbi:hypothetical protein BDR03DRAFT_972217 [Suillus americanus]|nr:hypothetical protein BDR03DRAFT_972217 [Suillus americanus]